MRNFKSITIRNERQFRAFTGLCQKEFDRLLPEFTQALESAQQQHYKKQHRNVNESLVVVVKVPYLHLN